MKAEIRNARRWLRNTLVVRPRRPTPRLPAAAPSSWAAALIAEKVVGKGLGRLRAEAPEVAARLEQEPRLSEYRKRLDTVALNLDPIRSRLAQIGRETGVAILGVKGLASLALYENPAERDLGDIDLMVADLEGAVKVAEALRSDGFTFERQELPWLKRSGSGLYGQFNLKFAELHGRPNVDVHFGGYSVRHCALAPIPIPEKPGYDTVDLATNLVMLVGNAAGDHRISTKDLNDLRLYLDVAGMDWERATDALEKVGLLGFLKIMLRDLADVSEIDKAGTLVVDRLLNAAGWEWPRPGPTFAWRRRWLATTLHAAAHGFQRSIAGGVRNGVTAAGYYWRPMHLSLVERLRERFRMQRLDEVTCVRLVPLELLDRLLLASDTAPLRAGAAPHFTGRGRRISTSLEVVENGSGTLVRTPLGDFIPTVDYRLGRTFLKTLTSANPG